jgi:CubicO group peptidase (beta-lactamase class C family)
MKLNETFEAQDRTVPLNGVCDTKFRGVVDAFMANYREEDEVGSGVSVVVDGRPVVDVWGGWKDGARQREWQADTIVCVMSVSKGIAAMAFNMLIERGLIDINEPVASYWPEFAQNGKQDIPVRYLLDHRSGLPVINDKMWPGAIYDRVAMVNALAAQAPLWKPGTTAAYQVTVQGYMLGEIMRRVTGKTLGPFVADEICGPLHADFLLGGLSKRDQLRCAEILPNMGSTLLAAKEDHGESLRSKIMLQYPADSWAITLNSADWRESEIASGNGHGTAGGIARIMGVYARGGEVDGIRVATPTTIETMITEQHHQIEIMQDRHYHQGLGVLLNSPDAVYMGPNQRSFGHHGVGGSIGFADPDAGIGFSYVVNRFHAVGTNGPRARRLIDALYASL